MQWFFNVAVLHICRSNWLLQNSKWIKPKFWLDFVCEIPFQFGFFFSIFVFVWNRIEGKSAKQETFAFYIMFTFGQYERNIFCNRIELIKFLCINATLQVFEWWRNGPERHFNNLIFSHTKINVNRRVLVYTFMTLSEIESHYNDFCEMVMFGSIQIEWHQCRSKNELTRNALDANH